MSTTDPYAVLGVMPNATAEEVGAAYAAILQKLKRGDLDPVAAIARMDEARLAYKQITTASPSPSTNTDSTIATSAAPPTSPTAEGALAIKFTGNASEFFRIWVVNVCLSVITLGIYSAWAKVRRKRYFYGNTLIHDAAFEYLADPRAILKGRLIVLGAFVLLSLINQFFHIKVLGIVYLVVLPYIVIKAARFNAQNSSYRNVRFGFGVGFQPPTGRFKSSTEGYRETSQFLILPTILITLSLGLLYPYYVFRKRQFFLEHSAYGTTRFAFDAKAGAYYRAYFKIALVFIACIVGSIATLGIGLIPLYILFASYRDAAVGKLNWNHTTLGDLRFGCRWKTGELFKLNFVNSLGAILSFGLLIPWMEIRAARYQLQGISLTPAAMLDGFVAAEQQQVEATGDEAGDLLGFDFGL